MTIIKEATDEKDAPFIGYAKKQGIEDEGKILAILKKARDATAKSNDKEHNEFESEDMAEVWKNFKDMLNVKEESINEAFMDETSVETLRQLLFEVRNQDMSVRDLRQFLFRQNQHQPAIKVLFKAI